MFASEPTSSTESSPRRHSLTPFALHNMSSTQIDHANPSTEGRRALSRRHSLVIMRKPFRSSPLAGPALAARSVTEETAPVVRFTRIVSTPDLHHRARSKASNTIAPKLPTPSPERPPGLSKRASLIELLKRPLALKTPPPNLPLPPPPSTVATSDTKPSANGSVATSSTLRAGHIGSLDIVHTSVLLPPLSPRSHARARSRGSLNPSMSMNNLSSSFLVPPPSFPRAITAPSSTRRSATYPLPRSTNTGPIYRPTAVDTSYSQSWDQVDTRERGDNWLTSLPFGETPRFSRLSLSAPNVVLPVSARASRRKSLRGQGGKRVSLIPVPVTPPRSSSLMQPPPSPSYTQDSNSFSDSPSTPDLVTHSSSRSLSSEGPVTPSASTMPTVFSEELIGVAPAEDDELEIDGLGVDPTLVSCDIDVLSQNASSENIHGLVLSAAPSAWTLPRRHRRDQVHAKGMSFFSFDSSDSTSTWASVETAASPTMSPAYSHSPSRIPRDTSRLAASVQSEGSQRSDVISTASANTKKGGAVRRFFRSLSGAGRRGT